MAPSFLPIRRILLPKKTNAMMTPTNMQSTVSHIRPVPYTADMPPNPTMAEVLMKAAPYDSARTTGLILFPAIMKSSAFFVCRYPR